jgi:putative tricarboxylic transport membrane protein
MVPEDGAYPEPEIGDFLNFRGVLYASQILRRGPFGVVLWSKGMRMSIAGLVFTGVCIVIALVFMIPAFSFPGGTVDGAPGPGYFPIIVCTIIIILGVILGVSYTRKKEKYFQTNETERSNLPVLLVTGGAVVIYTVAFMFIPFIPLTVVFLVFINWLYKRKWVFNIIFSMVFTLILFFVFSKFLHVMLK